ncbi:hypothetical protein TCAL_06602 [Tigriopus californicus]|uniref:Exoribonuclease phosphorolytic domain-containing protein n=1 Tax=Tigriopus californicus TaxID=6832 RepID=A0A553PNS8_TIGCA|nr:exosome complex component RRP46-like [Tigriopus californicus]TRY79335.1 hypothetical protein TCAL_06602 [Tigriopus californicus]|eukprot:TCALIF_06602-PA protein Name:"Similar to EXOSC5 Exosome complex component RRP46 (Homo sapiens)" AED:0.30 eAED:0.30 QI:0/-1/0/1/-1/1/1/0/221
MPVKDKALELRPLFAQLGLLGHTDGSVMFSLGQTAVICGVYGPAEVKPHKERLEGATVEISLRPPSGPTGLQEKAKEAVLKGLVESSILGSLHPRTSVFVSLQPLDMDGGELAAAVNATCLALMDCSISMRCLFASVEVTRTEDGIILLDPSQKQATKAVAKATFVFESVNQDVLASHLEGRWSEKAFQAGLQAALDGSKAIFQFYRETVKRKFSKELMMK